MDIAHYCGRCLKSHNYTLDFSDAIRFDLTVHVKAVANDCVQKHYIYRVYTVHDYKMACIELGIIPKEEVF